MANQGPIRMTTESALAVNEPVSNVATNQAQAKEQRALNVDGKKIYPETVFANDLYLKTDLSVGSGVTLTDGCVKSNHVATDAITTDKVAAGAVTANEMTVSTLSSITANLGDVTAGSVLCGAGGITIKGASDGSSGVIISSNQIRLRVGGVDTVTLDGATGVVTATKFNLTSDASSTVDLSLGSIRIGAGTYVGAGTESISTMLGDISDALSLATTAQETADGEIVGWFQASAPAVGMKFGDIWIDTDLKTPPDSTCIFRYQDITGGSQEALAWRAAPSNAIGLVYLNAWNAQNTANGALSSAAAKITTFYQAAIPTAVSAGDFWVDTDDGNKLYRAAAVGANEIKAGEWVLARDAGATAGGTAVQPGNGVTLNAYNQVTTIDCTSGIVVKSATTGAGVVMNSTGIFGCTDLANPTTTWTFKIENSTGMATFKGSVICQNKTSDSSPTGASKVIFQNNAGTEKMSMYAPYTGSTAYLNTASGTELIINSGAAMYLVSGAADIVLKTGGWFGTDELTIDSSTHAATFAGAVQGIHKSADGSYKANGSFTFYAATTSGGSPTKLHTVTFEDGLIVSWSAA